MKQRCVLITAAGGPEVLHVQHDEVPAPGAGQVRIRIEAAGVNRHDCNQRSRGPTTVHSNIPGLEVSGIVDAVGPGVTQASPGDRVCALVDGGGYAQYVLAEEQLVLPIPEGMDFIAAASLPEAAFTTWYNLYMLAAMQPGESLLIYGGTSGVGVFAIQLLTARGHSVYVACGSDEKCNAALELGAVAAVNYRREPIDGSLVGKFGREIDVVLDMSAGAHTAATLDALAWRGRIVHLSPGRNAMLQVPLATILRKEAKITGALMRPLPLVEKAKVAQALREHVWPRLGTAVQAVVAEVFGVEDAVQAHAAMERAQHVGKIVLRVSH
jgi:putative PIG3 family NAD(P)H quinone oxidoreductase